MTTQIRLDNMKFYAFHGVMEQERKVGNHFRVDLTITAPLEEATRTDILEDTINYAEVFAVVKREMTIPSRLLEHVGGRILASLKASFPQITALEVKVSKMSPPFGGDVESAAVILRETYTE
ncbi:dihydroneopterin aldolase [Parabacteroides sp. PFB2-10]|uniref:dihydroneopterin aldolase n=1 Tax=Parabacteroides sp. PFB2-10 TaxID=1742405 RepID=UPI002474CFF6|nr:dihydroneopterin aldolase [Parabacteroides sp. PFB2-10]MDH6312984.1 dihydroneopterin aldolase [Parabacteroides sp. PFB2-10]